MQRAKVSLSSWCWWWKCCLTVKLFKSQTQWSSLKIKNLECLKMHFLHRACSWSVWCYWWREISFWLFYLPFINLIEKQTSRLLVTKPPVNGLKRSKDWSENHLYLSCLNYAPRKAQVVQPDLQLGKPDELDLRWQNGQATANFLYLVYPELCEQVMLQ